MLLELQTQSDPRRAKQQVRKSIKERRGRPLKDLGKKLKSFNVDFIKEVSKHASLPPYKKKHLKEDLFLDKLSEFDLAVVRSTL